MRRTSETLKPGTLVQLTAVYHNGSLASLAVWSKDPDCTIDFSDDIKLASVVGLIGEIENHRGGGSYPCVYVFGLKAILVLAFSEFEIINDNV